MIFFKNQIMSQWPNMEIFIKYLNGGGDASVKASKQHLVLVNMRKGAFENYNPMERPDF